MNSNATQANSLKCMAMAGFLIPRPCRKEATDACPQCNLPICAEHTVPFPAGGVSCPACAKANQPQNAQNDVYDQYGYDTHGFGYSFGRSFGGGYTNRDYDAFDGNQAHPGGGPMESLDGS